MRFCDFVAAVCFFCASSTTALADQSAACEELSVTISTTPAMPLFADNLRGSREIIENVPSTADVVLVGDSLFANWTATLDRSFPGQKVWNFSIGGDKTQQILWRFQKSRINMTAPHAVAILVGTNNISDRGATGCGTFAGIKAIVSELKTLWPSTPVFVLNIPPRGADYRQYNNERVDLNSKIEKIANRDEGVFPVVFDENELTCGGISKQELPENTMACYPDLTYKCKYYRSDNLHFTNEAYPVLRRYLGEASVKYLGRDAFQ